MAAGFGREVDSDGEDWVRCDSGFGSSTGSIMGTGGPAHTIGASVTAFAEMAAALREAFDPHATGMPGEIPDLRWAGPTRRRCSAPTGSS